MAALGAIGIDLAQVVVPRIDAPGGSRKGALTLSASAQLTGDPASLRVDLYDARMTVRLMSTYSAVDGSFLFRNLAAGRYCVLLEGRGDYRSRVYVFDVS
jgi:hypothetical protein